MKRLICVLVALTAALLVTTARAEPPAPASDLRVVARNGGWSLTWKDNSDNEATFQPGILVLNESGTIVNSVDMAAVGENVTSAPIRDSLNPSDPPFPAGCYRALLLVFAKGTDGAVTWPGNAYTRICTQGQYWSFPDAGSGRDAVRWGAAALVALATLLALAGAFLWRMRRARR